MKKFKYRVTILVLCEGFDVNMKFIRRWRKYNYFRYYTKAKALLDVKYFTDCPRYKAILRKEV